MVVVAAGLTATVFYLSWYFTLKRLPGDPSPDDWKNFYSLVGVGIAAVTGITGVWVSVRNAGKQASLSKELETLKSELGRDLERVKAVLEKSIPAYGTLYAAASRYYRSLAPLETGNFNLDVIEDAETNMKLAEGDTLFVIGDYVTQWRHFWQMARAMKEEVNKGVVAPEARKEFWRRHAKPLGDALNGLKHIADRVLRS